MKMDTAIPPRYRRNLNKSSFVCMGHKETAASIFKAAFQMGVLIELLHDGFFSLPSCGIFLFNKVDPSAIFRVSTSTLYQPVLLIHWSALPPQRTYSFCVHSL